MKAPSSEPGWEVLLGSEAAEQWGYKDREVHQVWKFGLDQMEWRRPAAGGGFAPTMWYRRPCAVHPVMEHFI